MTRPVTRGVGLSDAWPLPLFLLRTAWADQPFDELTAYVSGLSPAHLVESVGEPVGMLADLSPAAGPTVVLPSLVTTLRRVGGEHAAVEVLSLLTAAPGDTSSLPPVPAVRADVSEAGWGLLVRDPANREAVCVTCVRAHDDVLRWRLRGVVDCPAAPQPVGPSPALADLGRAVVDAAEIIERSAPAGPGRGRPVAESPSHVTRLPVGLPPRVLEILDRVDRVDAVIASAFARPADGAEHAVREPVLRRLAAVQDAARRSAVAAAGAEALRGG